MPEMKLTATKREILGKKTKQLRSQGLTPAHLFGHALESLPLQCNTTELLKILAQAGTTRLLSLKIEGDKETKKVFVREIQKDVLSRQLLHVDFYQVNKDEKMQMSIPIVLVGDAPALRGKGRMVSRGITEIRVECLPEKVPPQIDVDISILKELEQGIYVKDFVLDPDIIVHADPQQLVVKVTEVIVKVEEEKVVVAAEGEAAEGEAGAAEGAEGAAKPGAEGAAKPGAEGAAKPGAGGAAKPGAGGAAKPGAGGAAKPGAGGAAKPGAGAAGGKAEKGEKKK
jgi:large subunit ribosomal protein L25